MAPARRMRTRFFALKTPFARKIRQKTRFGTIFTAIYANLCVFAAILHWIRGGIAKLRENWRLNWRKS
jgi:hypothetical protein